jgi:hypothetical protein
MELVEYHFEAKAFLMQRGDGRARPAGGRGLTAAASALWALAAAQKGAIYNGKWYKMEQPKRSMFMTRLRRGIERLGIPCADFTVCTRGERGSGAWGLVPL